MVIVVPAFSTRENADPPDIDADIVDVVVAISKCWNVAENVEH